MRTALAALILTVGAIAVGEGCAPVPLPRYAAYPPRRVEELLVDSENMRQLGDDWERLWFESVRWSASGRQRDNRRSFP